MIVDLNANLRDYFDDTHVIFVHTAVVTAAATRNYCCHRTAVSLVQSTAYTS